MRFLHRAVVVFAAAAHFAYLVYVPSGGFLALRWPRTIWLHLAAVLWGVAVVRWAAPCPLTWLENVAREKAQMRRLGPGGFIDHYVEGVLYPADATRSLQLLAFSAAGVSWLVFARAADTRRVSRRAKC
ncbi:hypothetical protein JMUB5695_04210 [Mycobacterium heckeshornense]|uniref:DUF2784 domain-containing protein n=1 Tax=Mycobacterium heckeshornense TaxID=110505 RepID=UPI0019444CE5|nr:DUF2784 domain-containing protein [Mycobacterium heckeshornense]BCQ10751.1 hypothetical protein JMUB5695_04210 [Mycobacterium heckeshornense]